MNRLSLSFFTAAVLCVTTGMVWGAIMGATENFALAPAHAHLNLVGWASLAIMGTFYALTGRGGRVGWVNFILSVSGVAVMIPSLALLLSGNKGANGGVVLGTVLAILGMLAFLVSVVSTWRDIAALEADALNRAALKEAA